MFKFLEKLFGKKSKPTEHRFEAKKTEKEQEFVPVQQQYRSQVTPVQPQNIAQESSAQYPQKPIQAFTQTQQPARPQITPGVHAPARPQATIPEKTITRQDEIKQGLLITEKDTAPKPVAPQRTSPINQPEIKPESSVITRRTVAPRVQRNVEAASGRRTQKSSVYIGLDFGTTFTKAAYEIAPSNVHTKYSIKFGPGNASKDYYLPSVLYFDPSTRKLNIFNSTADLVEIRYFKYNMISDALQKNKAINDPQIVTRTPKEQLCCVFFLSYVIHTVREAVNKSFSNTVLNDNTSWYINMGVPLEAHKDDTRAFLYKKVLEIAYLFEQRYHGETEISIHELDDFFVEHIEESNPHMNILPEIYAEVLLYQQYLNTPAGFYTVVDIGGGTEDIATFLKTTDRFGEKVECLAQNVIGYGYDSISEKIVHSITKTSIQKAKSFMNKKINFNNEAELRENTPREVNFDALLDARKQCRTLFGTCVQRARKTREEILKQTVSAHLPMHVFIMGGARDVEFYRASIEHMKKAQMAAGIPFFKDADVFDYVGRNTRLEIRNDQRLIISQMLAQPYEMIPEIDKMPWDLKEQDVTSKGLSWFDLLERQNELYPE